MHERHDQLREEIKALHSQRDEYETLKRRLEQRRRENETRRAELCRPETVSQSHQALDDLDRSDIQLSREIAAQDTAIAEILARLQACEMEYAPLAREARREHCQNELRKTDARLAEIEKEFEDRRQKREQEDIPLQDEITALQRLRRELVASQTADVNEAMRTAARQVAARA